VFCQGALVANIVLCYGAMDIVVFIIIVIIVIIISVSVIRNNMALRAEEIWLAS